MPPRKKPSVQDGGGKCPKKTKVDEKTSTMSEREPSPCEAKKKRGRPPTKVAKMAEMAMEDDGKCRERSVLT